MHCTEAPESSSSAEDGYPVPYRYRSFDLSATNTTTGRASECVRWPDPRPACRGSNSSGYPFHEFLTNLLLKPGPLFLRNLLPEQTAYGKGDKLGP